MANGFFANGLERKFFANGFLASGLNKELVMTNNIDNANSESLKNDGAAEVITYLYKFTFNNGVEKEFNVKLDKETLNLIQTKKKSYPKWTELNFFKCPNCLLAEDQHKFCPVAVSLVNLIDFFKDSVSHEEVDILIETEERGYVKHTPLQHGISSLTGIYMVTSGCPIMEKLKPMVCHHLPFATTEETMYRVISMYLLAQYFLYKRGKKPDWDLKKLVKIYEDIQIVNENFYKRLSSTAAKDASVNALVILDIFAKYVTISIDSDTLNAIESLFNSYLEATEETEDN